MANCHNLFEKFNQDISLTPNKRSVMSYSKTSLRDRIRKHFKEKHPDYEPKFYIQGSFKMKTTIRTKDDTCDLDDGVYFFRKPDVEPTTLQRWIWDAVNGYTGTIPEHRKKCVRSIFAKDYEIDMPVYHKVDGEEYKLAVKNTGWEESDPKAMVDWFVARKDENGQLVKIVKYLKTWRDFRNLSPNGLSLTILTTRAKERIVYNSRHDITLRDTLKEIKRKLNESFDCIVPAVPGDNLFDEYDTNKKEKFLLALNSFIDDAESAIREPNQLKASKLWQKHLGDRFPDGENKEDNQLQEKDIKVAAASSRPWGC